MGRTSRSGGVEVKGDRIQLTFTYRGQRRRPTLDLRPNAVNLKHARKELVRIKRAIANGTFDFAKEFPDYRFLDDIAPAKPEDRPTLTQMREAFVAARKGDLAHSTIYHYGRLVKNLWEPMVDEHGRTLGSRTFLDITYTTDLAPMLGSHEFKSRKTRNNAVSALRQVFEFGYADHPTLHNPAEKLKIVRLQRPQPDPYDVGDALELIGAIRKDWGENDANYFEMLFFAGPRASEAIALDWPNVDLKKGTGVIDRARVMGRDKDSTKTYVPREIEFCPRIVAMLKRQFALTGLAGGPVFTNEHGDRWTDLQVQLKRWTYTHKKLRIRYRPPMQARHSSVSWNLMMGKHPMWVADQHGHSVAVMMKTYAKWQRGVTEADINRIREAFGFATSLPLGSARGRGKHLKVLK